VYNSLIQGYTLFTFHVEFVSVVVEDLEIHGTYQLLVCAGISASGLCGKSAFGLSDKSASGLLGKSADLWDIGFWSV